MGHNDLFLCSQWVFVFLNHALLYLSLCCILSYFIVDKTFGHSFIKYISNWMHCINFGLTNEYPSLNQQEDIRRAAAHLLLLHREIANTTEAGDKSLLKDGCEDDMNTGNLCDYNCIQGREVDQEFYCKNRRDILPYIANLSKQLEIQVRILFEYKRIY